MGEIHGLERLKIGKTWENLGKSHENQRWTVVNHGYNDLGEYVFERLKMGKTLWEIKSSWVRIGDFSSILQKKAKVYTGFMIWI